MFNFNRELVVFDVEPTMRYPSEKMDCCKVDIVDSCVVEVLNAQKKKIEPQKRVII